MKRFVAVALLSCAALSGSELLDRTVAVVGREAVTESEVQLQMRLEAMFNGAEPTEGTPSAEERTTALNRLIDRRLIEADMRLAGFQGPTEEELSEAVETLKQSRFRGRSFALALEDYGISEKDALEFYGRQLVIQGYIDFRFRTGLDIDEDEVKAAHRRLYRDLDEPPSLDEVREELAKRLLEEKIERLIDARIKQLRAESRIRLLDRIGRHQEARP